MRIVKPLTCWLWGMVLVAALAGCGELTPKGRKASAMRETIPAPIDLLLPRTLEIHPFTQTGSFETGENGVHARVKAVDAFGDATKAFGDFRLELYEFRPQHQGKKGGRLAQWEVSVADPETNLLHWDRHTHSYEFKLGWERKVPTGQRLVLVAVFTSRFTPRITAEREIVVGE